MRAAVVGRHRPAAWRAGPARISSALPAARTERDEVYSLSPEADGSLWIGTDQGLDHRLRDGRIEQPAWRAGLPDPGVTSVLRDREGTRWITTRRGLVRERDGVSTRWRAPRRRAASCS